MYDRNVARRIALIHEKIQVGGSLVGDYKYCKVELTTWAKTPEKNDMEVFSKDLRKLIIRLRSLGYKFEYVMERGLSPKSGLVHGHGIFRFQVNPDGSYGIPSTLLSQEWERIHGAKIVKITVVGNMAAVRKYIAGHMVKAMKESRSDRLLVSSGWLPEGWVDVRKTLRRWVTSHDQEMWPELWPSMNRMFCKWVNGHTLQIPVNGRWIVLGEGGIIFQ